MQRIVSGLKKIWEIIKRYFHNFIVFILNSLKCTKEIASNWRSYVIFALFLSELCLSSIAFYDNTFLSIYADSFYISKSIIDSEYLDFTFQTYSKKIDSKEFNRLNELIFSMNQYTYERTFTFLSLSSHNYDSPTTGRIASISSVDDSISLELNFNSGISTFSNYTNEWYGTKFFAGTHLEKILNSEETIFWRNFPFEGKDASSYISSDFAEYVININPNDQFSTYDDLIGMKIKYELDNGQNYYFSVNNIYNAISYFGPAVTETLGTPIITDCSKLFTTNPVSIYSSCIGSVLDLRELFYQLGPETQNGYEFMCYYVNANGNRISCDNSQLILDDILNVGTPDYSMMQNTNIIAFVFLILIILSQFIFVIFFSLKSKMSSKSLLVIGILFSLVFMIVDGIIFSCFGGSIIAYKLLNFVFGLCGSLIPILLVVIHHFTTQVIKKRKGLNND